MVKGLNIQKTQLKTPESNGLYLNAAASQQDVLLGTPSS
jgi:hypothetical protein